LNIRIAIAAACITALLQFPARADEPPPPPPASGPRGSTDPLWLQYVVLGAVLAAGVAFMVGSVIAAGDEKHRKDFAAPYDYMMAVVSPLGGPGAFSMATGFAGLGTYNLLNHHSSGTRMAVNGAGIALAFTASLVERRITLGAWKDRRKTLLVGPSQVALLLRF
jgi:hypothetical protein